MIKKYDNITCAVLTYLDLGDLGGKFFKLIESYGLIEPTHIGNEEPIKETYQSGSEALVHWRNPLLWRNTKTKTRGSVWMGKNTCHSCVYVKINPTLGLGRSDELLGFLGELGGLLKADFGYIHYTTEVEWGHPSSTHESVYAVDTGVTSHDLRYGIPNVCWAMLLGPPYDDVARCFPGEIPGEYARTEVGENAIIRADVSLSSLRTEFEQFLEVRERIKERMKVKCIGTKKHPASWHPAE